MRQALLPSALDLRDGARTYVRRLGDDGGKSARMIRSSHRGLLQPPAEALAKAWREVRVDLLGTSVEQAYEDAGFVGRTDALNALSDHPKHAEEFDQRVRDLLAVIERFIQIVESASNLGPDDELAAELNYKSIHPVRPGGFGVLYRGIDFADVAHAIKILHPSPFVSADTAEPRFRREADALKQLSHPGIVKYRRLGRLRDGRWFLEMEFVAGQMLGDWASSGPSFIERAIAILHLLDALDHAHRTEVFHRDIKPDNVMVRDDSTVILVDFGLAWLTGQADASLTARSTWSPDYAPPEVRDDPKHSRGANHDIYSVGVVLHQIFAGRRPGTPNRVPLAHVDPRLAVLDPVIDRALAPLPGRFATASQFRDALATAIEGIDQPWLSRISAATSIRNPLLRTTLVAAAEAAHDERLEEALLGVIGAYEALRIHWQREFRLARGSDAPWNEDYLPAVVSPAAASRFPEHGWLWQEPSLKEDKYGEAAMASLGFSVSEQGGFRDLIEATHPIRSPSRTPRPEPTEEALLEAHRALVDRIVNLETREATIMSRFGTPPVTMRERLDAVTHSGE
jgi:serine/threonine protein kinase